MIFSLIRYLLNLIPAPMSLVIYPRISGSDSHPTHSHTMPEIIKYCGVGKQLQFPLLDRVGHFVIIFRHVMTACVIHTDQENQEIFPFGIIYLN